jgi:hypothetical protein
MLLCRTLAASAGSHYGCKIAGSVFLVRIKHKNFLTGNPTWALRVVFIHIKSKFVVEICCSLPFNIYDVKIILCNIMAKERARYQKRKHARPMVFSNRDWLDLYPTCRELEKCGSNGQLINLGVSSASKQSVSLFKFDRFKDTVTYPVQEVNRLALPFFVITTFWNQRGVILSKKENMAKIIAAAKGQVSNFLQNYFNFWPHFKKAMRVTFKISQTSFGGIFK